MLLGTSFLRSINGKSSNKASLSPSPGLAQSLGKDTDQVEAPHGKPGCLSMIYSIKLCRAAMPLPFLYGFDSMAYREALIEAHSFPECLASIAQQQLHDSTDSGTGYGWSFFSYTGSLEHIQVFPDARKDFLCRGAPGVY